jgi:hypothetical protein
MQMPHRQQGWLPQRAFFSFAVSYQGNADGANALNWKTYIHVF